MLHFDITPSNVTKLVNTNQTKGTDEIQEINHGATTWKSRERRECQSGGVGGSERYETMSTFGQDWVENWEMRANI
jgi:hypothetical protein